MRKGVMNGTVEWFDSKKGYGFIKSGDKSYFVHWKDVKNRPVGVNLAMANGTRVTFEVGYFKQREKAANVYIEE